MGPSRFYQKKRWWGSPFNDIPQVYRKNRLQGQAIQIQDVTLGDWGKSCGCTYDLDDATQIIDLLAQNGVTRIDIGGLRHGITTIDMARLCGNYPDVQFDVHVGTDKSQIDTAIACGASGVIVSPPLGYPRLRQQSLTLEEALANSEQAIQHARKQGLAVTLAPEDLTRARPEDFEAYTKAIARRAAPDHWRINDDTGSTLPQALAYIVRRSQKLLKGIPVQVRVSNGYGLALASTLSALMEGAQVACTAINGLGGPGGMAATEEVILCLYTLLGDTQQWKPDELFRLSLLAEQITGLEIPPFKPFAGHRNFCVTQEEYQAVSLQPLCRFGVDPRLFGREVQQWSHSK